MFPRLSRHLDHFSLLKGGNKVICDIKVCWKMTTRATKFML
uniref:Uncharacterized protein n=1 Tax=Rhizophora mucronata TaxID=61149 RepID=A0A2P2QZU6_RHIMU